MASMKAGWEAEQAASNSLQSVAKGKTVSYIGKD